MPRSRRAHISVPLLAIATAIVALAAARLVPIAAASGASLGQLNSQLSQQQTHQQSLSSHVSSLSQLISSLTSQIALVQSREAAVQAALSRDRAALAAAQRELARERVRLAVLKAQLGRARLVLSRQLLSGYEGDKPDLVAVVLEAHGFTDLLEKVSFLHDAQRQQQSIIRVTREAKAAADAATARLAKLEKSDAQITTATAVRAQALAGMNSLLQSKQGALQHARAAQQAALAASRARGAQLQSAISRIEAQQASAQQASAGGSGSGSSASFTSGPALGPSGGWAIPYAIVLCESGGQNLPPNGAGASGYYQIIPGTWKGFGGSGPAAYLTSKAEQDAVASRIWNGGKGASNWVCAGMVGIH
jgi:septal ring factor EnvC (AmiA/AmiB activator)